MNAIIKSFSQDSGPVSDTETLTCETAIKWSQGNTLKQDDKYNYTGTTYPSGLPLVFKFTLFSTAYLPNIIFLNYPANSNC